MVPGNEFEYQIRKHQEKIQEHFGIRSNTFRNTELIYSDQIGERVSKLGFKGVFTDGIDRILRTQSPHYIFQHPEIKDLNILLRNYRLSDDIAFRFSNKSSPLTVDQYLTWLRTIPTNHDVINLAMDYETFGEHQKKEAGIFSFLENLLTSLAREKAFRFMTPSGAIETIHPLGSLSVPTFISWADEERDLSAWLGNEMQRDAFDSLYKMAADLKSLGNHTLLEQWRILQASDHFYYMSTKKGNDGGVHSYFSPYPSPYEAFINYMNVLTDFSLQVRINKAAAKERKKSKKLAAKEEYADYV